MEKFISNRKFIFNGFILFTRRKYRQIILSTPDLHAKLKFVFPLDQLTLNISHLLRSIYKNNTHNSPSSSFIVNVNPPWLDFSQENDFSLTEFTKPYSNSFIAISHFNELITKYPNHQFLFTEGSKNLNKQAAHLFTKIIKLAVVFLLNSTSAELYAAIKITLTYIRHISS